MDDSSPLKFEPPNLCKQVLLMLFIMYGIGYFCHIVIDIFYSISVV